MTTAKSLALTYFARFPHDSRLTYDILAPDIVFHHLVDIEGQAAFGRFMGMVSAAFPDFRFDVHHLVADDNLAVGHYTFAGTQEGEFLGAVAASGRPFAAPGMNLFRVEGDRIIEIWSVFNSLSMLQQLGAVPEIGPLRRP